jgi:hypothetical protein
VRPYHKNKAEIVRGLAHVVESFSSKHGALSLNSNIAKKKIETKTKKHPWAKIFAQYKYNQYYEKQSVLRVGH